MKKLLLWTLGCFWLFIALGAGCFGFLVPETQAEELALVPRAVRIIEQDETWTKKEGKEVTGGIIVKNGATLTVEAGAKINFKREGEDPAPFIWVIEGEIKAIGTEREKISFTSEQEQSGFFLVFDDQGGHQSFFRYVTVEKGGGRVERQQEPAISVAASDDSADFLAERYPATILYRKGKVHFENSSFINNNDAVFFADHHFKKDENMAVQLEIVNSNFKGNGDGLAILSNLKGDKEIDPMACAQKLFLQNNWYGATLGPQVIRKYPADYFAKNEHKDEPFKGEKIIGVFFWQELFRTEELIADPVVIIPGIMGSMEISGEWVLDPILHTYDDLTDALKRNGFAEDKNLFYFPYQWRDSNVENAKLLKTKLADINKSTRVSKVDLVAHSMGGLLARQLIQSGDYTDSVDQLITLGTPHRGAPEAYLKWEAAEGFDGRMDKIVKGIFKLEAWHQGYRGELQRYIQEQIPTVKELLPDYSYLFDLEREKTREYPNNYPQNQFLEKLNSEESLKSLEKVNFVNIMGEVGSQTSTISQIRVQQSTVSNKWEHGMPENYYNKKTDRGLEHGEGDETVPSFSAESAPANRLIKLSSGHGKLPTKAQCEVFQELTAQEHCSYDEDTTTTNFLTFGVFSPVDIQVIAPDGKRIGKDFVTGKMVGEIEKAFYSGFKTENEFVVIPNPKKGEYQLLTQGTGAGEYRIEITKIWEKDKLTEEAAVVFKGVAQKDSQEKRKVEVLEDKIIIKEQDQEAPTINIIAPKERGEYTNQIELKLEIELRDNLTSKEEIVVEIKLDGNSFEGEKLKLPLTALGEHLLLVRATDKAGNVAESRTQFSVTTDLDALIANIGYYYDKGLIKNIREKRRLTALLLHIKHILSFRERSLACRRFRWRNRRMEQALERTINRRITFAISYLDRRNKKYLAPFAKARLIEGLQYIKNKN